MLRRARLPPPPPHPHIRTWPDRESLLADRAGAMAELKRRSLATRRLLLLWLLGLLAALGWALFSLGLGDFEARNANYLTGFVELVLGIVFVAPALAGLGLGIGRDRTVRRRLDAWAELGRDPANDILLRATGRGAVWLALSTLPYGIGLGLLMTGGGQPPSAGAGEVAYPLGLGVIALGVGAIGAAKALNHQLWAERLLSPVPPRGGGGAHR